MTLEAGQFSSYAAIKFASRLPKRGGQISECEDRFGAGADTFRVAIADGASASLLSGEWAEMLVEAYCANLGDDPAELAERIGAQAIAWTATVNAIELPWYARAKRPDGAFATLLGVDIQSDGQFAATAAGDSCVFQVRRDGDAASGAGRCELSFPMSSVGQFGSTPMLIATSGPPDPEMLVRSTGTWLPGDDLYLMTDALAEWFIGELQQRREPWRWFDALETSGHGLSFVQLIGDLRASGKLKDDDVTLLHVKLSGVDLGTDS